MCADGARTIAPARGSGAAELNMECEVANGLEADEAAARRGAGRQRHLVARNRILQMWPRYLPLIGSWPLHVIKHTCLPSPISAQNRF